MELKHSMDSAIGNWIQSPHQNKEEENYFLRKIKCEIEVEALEDENEDYSRCPDIYVKTEDSPSTLVTYNSLSSKNDLVRGSLTNVANIEDRYNTYISSMPKEYNGILNENEDGDYTTSTFETCYIKTELSTPIEMQTVKQPYTCDYCESRFAYQSQLSRHLKSHIDGETKFPRKNSLAKRRRTHTPSYDYFKDKFLQKYNLISHTQIPTVEPPYQCDQCRAKFYFKFDLTAHVLKHTDERPHVCNNCNAKFTRLSTLKEHMRIHAGEKPFTCDKCQMKFIRRSDLLRHVKKCGACKQSHNHCVYCNVIFTTKSGLTRHAQIHMRERS